MGTSGRHALIVGGTRGIGRAIAEGLAERGMSVWIGARDEASARRVAAALGGEERVLHLDLADPESLEEAAQQARERLPRLDALVLNAGLWSAKRVETASGVERTWAVNVLGHFRLLRRLTPLLERSAPSRVVWVASGLAHGLDLGDPEFHRRPYSGVAAYAQSKQANRMLARAFARRLEPAVAVSSMHPGFTRTRAFALGGGWQGGVAGMAATLFGRSPARAADTAVWLASDAPEAGGGAFWVDRERTPCEHRDEAAEEALYALCEARVGSAPRRAGGAS
jgi:NAD(P)-dependent dehydrogenase (short-subunit alcohol dehydrogenase family)